LKKLLVIFILLAFMGSSAQKATSLNMPKYDTKTLHFGFTISLNTMDFTIHNSGSFFGLDSVFSVENIPHVGFNLGIVSDLRLNKHFNMRFLPGLDFGQRDLVYIVKDTDSTLMRHTMKIESIFLDFPLTFKYRAKRINNYRPYLLAGFDYKYDLAAQKKIDPKERPKVRLARNDAYYHVGFGVDYYLPYFKFSTEIKFEVGQFNVLRPDDSQFTEAIERMNSKMIVLSFHFE